MRFLLNHYRTLVIWLSVIVLALAFVAGSDDGWRLACVTAAFLAGACMYSIGGVRCWMQKKKIGSAVETLLAVCMWTAFILMLLYLGGIL